MLARDRTEVPAGRTHWKVLYTIHGPIYRPGLSCTLRFTRGQGVKYALQLVPVTEKEQSSFAHSAPQH